LKPAPFEYFAPESVEEVVSLLSEHGDEAKILAGGQSLIPLLALRLASPTVVVDINRVNSLDYLRDGDGVLHVGALARHRAVERLQGLAERCPMLADAVGVVGHVAIRNRGTVVGSIAHADPAAEWPALALALDAEVDVVGSGGNRTIPADSMFMTYFTTTVEPEELVTEVRFRIPPGAVGSSFVELARRHGDFAVAGVGALVDLSNAGTIQDARVVLIGVADTPLRIREAEEVLGDREPVAASFQEAAEAVQRLIEPAGDIHGSADYRRAIAGVLTRRALAKATARAKGERVG
jgi:aerobic carbon-monoxide dehydrogenase medium subunit